MKSIGIIPARYNSSRFPGKPLAELNGKPMIQHVYEQAIKCKYLSEVIIATDDKRIQNAVNLFHGNVVMTSRLHKSGTDRCREALAKSGLKCDVIINIQGDEPLIYPAQISKVVTCFTSTKVQIATLAMKISHADELNNPNIVKVVLNKNNEALYFSRAALPYYRGKEVSNWLTSQTYYKHIGLYGYRADTLKEITRLKSSGLERAESLEQLRWLEDGYRIIVRITMQDSFSIDTPEDLSEAIRRQNKR